jgi:hypothetical protein
MLNRLLIFALLILSCSLVCGESKNILTVKRVNPSAVVLSCTNGADPTGKEIAYHVLIISCGE